MVRAEMSCQCGNVTGFAVNTSSSLSEINGRWFTLVPAAGNSSVALMNHSVFPGHWYTPKKEKKKQSFFEQSNCNSFLLFWVISESTAQFLPFLLMKCTSFLRIYLIFENQVLLSFRTVHCNVHFRHCRLTSGVVSRYPFLFSPFSVVSPTSNVAYKAYTLSYPIDPELLLFWLLWLLLRGRRERSVKQDANKAATTAYTCCQAWMNTRCVRAFFYY